MSISTNGFVCVPDNFKEATLEKLEHYIKTNFDNPVTHLFNEKGITKISFIDGVEPRLIYFFSNCDEDYCDVYLGSKVTISLGCWGNSVEIVTKLLNTVKSFGNCYIAKHNTGDDDFEQI